MQEVGGSIPPSSTNIAPRRSLGMQVDGVERRRGRTATPSSFPAPPSASAERSMASAENREGTDAGDDQGQRQEQDVDEELLFLNAG